MNNKFTIEDISVKDSVINCLFHVEGEWEKYFSSRAFYCEYNMNLNGLPSGIAVIPLICNVLPLAWLCGAELILPELDEDFYTCIDNLKKGYQTMYPQFSFHCTIKAKRVKYEMDNISSDRAGTFFSGGADAFHTLVRHIEERPQLITVWGADVKLNDKTGWEHVCKHVRETCREFNLENITIKSNFRDIVHEASADTLVRDCGDCWYHAFQHGIGLLGHGAPCAWKLGLNTLYIASSFCQELAGQYTCASDPAIDNYLRFCGCKIFHDAYEYSRQKKIEEICKYSATTGRKISLRVCWQSAGGENCCRCEKCYRTCLEIASEGYNPNDFGFVWDKKAKWHCRKDMMNKILILDMYIGALWKPIQRKMLERPEAFQEYAWLLYMDWDRFNHRFLKRLNNSRAVVFLRRCVRFIKKVS